jgi:hypothetical protein
MNDNRVKSYRDKELLDKVKSLSSFKGFPPGFWILGVQSNEDTYNRFDDKFYLFKGEKFVMVTAGTTNPGLTGLMSYERYSKNGVLVVKTDEWYHGLWKFGYHRGKMAALKQVRDILYYRDGNKNQRVEQIGKIYKGIRGVNFHTVSYTKKKSFIKKLIGGWSVGCQVVNNVDKYYKILALVKHQSFVTYCLIKEF